MRLLLDTHTFLWFLREPEKLPQQVLVEIESAGSEAVVSLVTLWEIAIKASLNKLYLPKAFDELFPQAVTDSGLGLLQLHSRYICGVSRLPWHHRDPFDRLLVAQAGAESLTLVTCDPQLARYGIPLLW